MFLDPDVIWVSIRFVSPAACTEADTQSLVILICIFCHRLDRYMVLYTPAEIMTIGKT